MLLWRGTHAPGHIEVKTNSGTLCRSCSGFDGPKTEVKVKPTSSAMYVVAMKNAAVKNEKGCVRDGDATRFPIFSNASLDATYRGKMRTTIELNVPSSTTCVLTSPFPRRVQKVAATVPAWIAVSTTSAVEPCSMNEPVVRSWKGRVRKYATRKMRNSILPVVRHAKAESDSQFVEYKERDVATHRRQPSACWFS